MCVCAVTMPTAAPRGAEPCAPASHNAWAIQHISVLSTRAGNIQRKPPNALTIENKEEYRTFAGKDTATLPNDKNRTLMSSYHPWSPAQGITAYTVSGKTSQTF